MSSFSLPEGVPPAAPMSEPASPGAPRARVTPQTPRPATKPSGQAEAAPADAASADAGRASGLMRLEPDAELAAKVAERLRAGRSPEQILPEVLAEIAADVAGTSATPEVIAAMVRAFETDDILHRFYSDLIERVRFEQSRQRG